MRTARSTLSLAVLAGLATLAAGCAKSAGGQTGDEDALPSDDFYADLAHGQGFGNYEPASGLSDLLDRSDRVVVGRVVALRAGRTFVLSSGNDSERIHTVVLEIAVERTLKGSAADSLYLAFQAGTGDESAAPQTVPHERVIAFALPAGDSWYGGATIEDEGAGLPSGEPLYQLTTPQGFVVAGKDGGFSQPLASHDGIFGDGDLDDVIGRIEQAVASSEPDGSVDFDDAGQALPGTGGSTGSAAGSDAPVLDAGTESCWAEAPFQPGANPVEPSCPASCYEVKGSPYDPTNNCVDYAQAIVIGCLDGPGPPVVVCIERIADGELLQLGGGWPFPDSITYRTCNSADTTTVLSAQSCP